MSKSTIPRSADHRPRSGSSRAQHVTTLAAPGHAGDSIASPSARLRRAQVLQFCRLGSKASITRLRHCFAGQNKTPMGRPSGLVWDQCSLDSFGSLAARNSCTSARMFRPCSNKSSQRLGT